MRAPSILILGEGRIPPPPPLIRPSDYTALLPRMRYHVIEQQSLNLKEMMARRVLKSRGTGMSSKHLSHCASPCSHARTSTLICEYLCNTKTQHCKGLIECPFIFSRAATAGTQEVHRRSPWLHREIETFPLYTVTSLCRCCCCHMVCIVGYFTRCILSCIHRIWMHVYYTHASMQAGIHACIHAEMHVPNHT